MYDLILTGGWIVDGTRAAPYKADLCIKDGQIAQITEHFEGEAHQILAVEGMTVSPGFIDIHSHSDICPLMPEPFTPQTKLYQGVTTEICGNCGISLVPNCDERRGAITDYFTRALVLKPTNFVHDMDSVSDYAKRVNKHKCTLNYGMLVGHGMLRGCVIGFEDRNPTESEMEQLKALLDRELTNGAYGMSLGLIYPPSAYALTEELVELAKVVKQHNAILSVHIRNESVRVFESVNEMLDVAKRSGVHLQISHLKLMGKPQWGRAAELLEKIETARGEGVHVTCDQYPYNASSTSLSAVVPGWAHNGGFDSLIERLKGQDTKLFSEISDLIDARGGPASILIPNVSPYMSEINGKNIEEISEMLKMPPAKAVAEIIIKTNATAKAIYFSMSDDDVLTIAKDMNICVGSDGYGFDYSMEGNPHPRSTGTFPRFLRLCCEKNLMPLEDAVYKMTGMPAEFLGITDRGVLKEGLAADITVFDAKTVYDTPDFVRSLQKPAGIKHVIVNGRCVLLNGEETGEKPGLALLR